MTAHHLCFTDVIRLGAAGFHEVGKREAAAARGRAWGLRLREGAWKVSA